MAKSVFSKRGIEVNVETTEVAEFDIAGYQISDAAMERVGSRLKAVTFSREDRVEGDVRIRLLEGYFFIFLVTRDADAVFVTIGGVELPDPEDPAASALKLAEKIATFRGALGL